jgi:thermitase
MNSWYKTIIALSAAVCLLALVALSSLVLRTTEVSAADARVPEWQPARAAVAPGEGSAAVPSLASLLPMVAQQTDHLLERLAQINAMSGVVPKELVLTFKSPEALAAFRQRAAADGFRIISSDGRLLAARVGYEDAAAMSRELARNAEDYENVGPNYLIWVPGLPETPPEADPNNGGGREPFYSSSMQAIGAADDRSTWGKGVTVAVLDTGVAAHEMLQHTQVQHYDLVADGQEPHGHGTAMASLIAGYDSEMRDGGAAVGSRLLDIRVADVTGVSNTALVAQGIMQAVDQGARVINISLGTTADALVLRRAVAYALERGVVIVAAAGNEQRVALAYPAAYEGVISVGAVDAARVQAFFSNSGPNLTLAAPGVGIISGYGGGSGLVISSGTSQAAAITSGVVAALLGRGYSSHNIRQLLVNAAIPTGAPKEQVGAGVLQVPK